MKRIFLLYSATNPLDTSSQI